MSSYGVTLPPFRFRALPCAHFVWQIFRLMRWERTTLIAWRKLAVCSAAAVEEVFCAIIESESERERGTRALLQSNRPRPPAWVAWASERESGRFMESRGTQREVASTPNPQGKNRRENFPEKGDSVQQFCVHAGISYHISYHRTMSICFQALR